MKKQTIYSCLQRSLVKVFTKSINSNKCKSSLAKPVNTISANLISYARTRSTRQFKKWGSMSFLLAKHKQSKTLNFFRKVNTKKNLRFTCKFSLIRFIRQELFRLFFRPYAETLLNLTLHSKLKLLKLNQGVNNKLVFLPLLHGTQFYQRAHSRNLFLQAKFCTNLLVTLFFVRLNFCHFNYLYRIKILVGDSLNHGADNFGQSKRNSKAFCFASFTRERSFFVNCNYSSSQLFSYSKKNWYLFQKRKEKKKNSNFSFYSKKPQLDRSLWSFPFGALQSYPFHQSFYKRKNQSINYIKTFHHLSDFFSIFSIRTNNKISVFNYAGLGRHAVQAQQVLALRTIDEVSCSFPLLYLSNTNNRIFPLCSLRNKTISAKKENQSSFFKVLPLLTLLFYMSIKYIKEKKMLSKQSTFFIYIYQFNEIVGNNFLSFRPFYGKVVEIYKALNLPFFLMRPLFSLTRLDTFFICESLKLPIYPDKSNLRVDFLRNRVRKQILPAIRILLNPQFDTILCKFNESEG